MAELGRKVGRSSQLGPEKDRSRLLRNHCLEVSDQVLDTSGVSVSPEGRGGLINTNRKLAVK